MSLDKKILSEIERYRNINKYIMEQDAAADPLGAPPPPAAAPDAAAPAAPAAPAPAAPAPEAPKAEPLDVEADPDVEKIDDEGKTEEKKGDETEELDVTELVTSQKNVEQKQEEYFDTLFNQLGNLEKKLGEMDQIMNKLNSLENKIERYREKTPQEKLELRTYDSYPYNQKLSDFFDDKKEEMEKTGKHDYILTSDQVVDMNVNDVKNSFQPGQNPTDNFEFKR
jgi:hypothetical protein